MILLSLSVNRSVSSFRRAILRVSEFWQTEQTYALPALLILSDNVCDGGSGFDGDSLDCFISSRSCVIPVCCCVTLDFFDVSRGELVLFAVIAVGVLSLPCDLVSGGAILQNTWIYNQQYQGLEVFDGVMGTGEHKSAQLKAAQLFKQRITHSK